MEECCRDDIAPFCMHFDYPSTGDMVTPAMLIMDAQLRILSS